MLTDFESMPDGHLGRISRVKQLIKVNDLKTPPNHKISTRVGPKPCELERTKLLRCVLTKLLSLIEKERGIIYWLRVRKNGMLRFCIDNRKLNIVTKQNFYFISRNDKCINSFKKPVFSQH